MRRWLALALAASAAGCVVSDVDLGVRIGCETESDCPEGQACEEGICAARPGPAEGEGEGEGAVEGEGEGAVEGEGEGAAEGEGEGEGAAEGEGEGGTEGEGEGGTEGEGEGGTEGEGEGAAEGEGEGASAGYRVVLQAVGWSSPVLVSARYRASLVAGRPLRGAPAAGGGYRLEWRGVSRLEVQR